MTQQIALHRDQGKSIWMLGHLMTFKATGGETGGAFGLVEQVGEPGTGAPPHIHHNEDEFFYVLEGEAPCRMLLGVSPAGFENFFAEMGEPAPSLTTPPPGPPDVEKLMMLAKKYNCEIMLPAPVAST